MQPRKIHIFLFMLSISLFGFGCTKNNSSEEIDPVSLTRVAQIELVYKDVIFENFLKIDKEIFSNVFDKSIDNSKIVKTFMMKIYSKQISFENLPTSLQNSGFANPKKLETLYNEKLRLSSALFSKYKFIGKMSENDRNSFLTELVLRFNETNTPMIKSLDECSSGYGSNMHACEITFSVEMAIVAGGAAISAVFGTPVAGGSVFFGGLAAASAHFYGCKHLALDTWRSCRQEHPLAN